MQTHTTRVNNFSDFKGTKKEVPKMDIMDFTEENNNNLLYAEENEDDSMRDLINKCKISLSEKLSPPPVAMQIMSAGKSITLFTKGNFSIITGPAKSRKSFLVSMLMAAALKGSFQDLFKCPDNGTNIIFDTEQSRYKVQQISKRVCKLAEQVYPSNFDAYSLRTLDPSQRIDLIDEVLKGTPNINFVAIDGIIDLDIDPILQAEQASKIIQMLMRWTEIYNIHIVCVLHYNKTNATLLGHLGSFSHRKADAIISVTKSKDDENVSLVEAVDCREKDFLPFAFSVDLLDMPYILNEYSFEGKAKEKKDAKKEKPKCISPNGIEELVHTGLLAEVFKIQKCQSYSELWRNIKNVFERRTGNSIGDNKAKEFIAYYLNNESIIKVDEINKKHVYTLAGQSVLNL